MPLVKYIGDKLTKDDNVSHSGVVWHGHGDIQRVPSRAWGALSKHPAVWELVPEEPEQQIQLDAEIDKEQPTKQASSINTSAPPLEEDEQNDLAATMNKESRARMEEVVKARGKSGKKAG